MANLTLERRVVQALDSARSVPGHHTVILKEEAGGRTLHRVLAPGEPFRKGLLERLGHYEAYAVSASPVLRHRFGEQLKTGTGERRDVAQPAVVAERLTEDPLGTLDAEIKSLLRDWASTLSLDALERPGFHAEDDFLHDRHGRAGPSRFETVQDLAAALGLEVQRVELIREFSVAGQEIGEQVVAEERKRKVERARQPTEVLKAEHEEALRHFRAMGPARVQQIEAAVSGVRSLVNRLDDALANVAQDTRTAGELRQAVRELVGASQAMTNSMSASGTVRPARVETSASKSVRYSS